MGAEKTDKGPYSLSSQPDRAFLMLTEGSKPDPSLTWSYFQD